MKLELKHLAPYLPYKLKMMSNNDFVSPLIRYLTVDGFKFIINTRKPILRPLSDLTIEIEVNGEKFVPINKLQLDCDFGDNPSIYDCSVNGNVGMEDVYFITEKLLEWKFDVYGLIEKGLAIDINTL